MEIKFLTVEKPELYGEGKPIYFEFIELCDYIESELVYDTKKTKVEFWKDIRKCLKENENYSKKRKELFGSDTKKIGGMFNDLLKSINIDEFIIDDLVTISELYIKICLEYEDCEKTIIGTYLNYDKGHFLINIMDI